jgi:hypothetical protein
VLFVPPDGLVTAKVKYPTAEVGFLDENGIFFVEAVH